MERPKPTLETRPKEWLSTQLASQSEIVRRHALEEVEKMGPAGVDLVLSMVRDEAKKRQNKRRCFLWGLGIYLSVIGAVVLIWVGKGLSTGRWDDFPDGLFNVFTYAGGFGAYSAASISLKSGAEWLAKFKDPRLVGPFLENLTSGDKDLAAIAQTSLIGLLPGLTREQAAELSPEHRSALRSYLPKAKRELIGAILTVFPKLSDVAAIPSVEGLIQKLERNGAGDSELLSQARSTLAHLEAARELEREKETLLRPADAASETLLRADTASAKTDPELLVRPVETIDTTELAVLRTSTD
jgi:hypothetical protein